MSLYNQAFKENTICLFNDNNSKISIKTYATVKKKIKKKNLCLVFFHFCRK